MDLDKLREILDEKSITEQAKEHLIISQIARDENVIPLVMKILDAERNHKKEMSSEMNVLLSKAHIGLDNKKFNKGNFMQKEIIEFYTKYKDYIGHCFKNI